MTTSVNTTKVYDEIIDFIAAGTTPQSVIDFKLSNTAQERLEDLVYKHKMGKLTPQEKKELDNFLTLEHIIRLAKARAYKYIDAE
ncbi:hypothetical protein [Fischerella sp. JS2]|uniref:hypothetical protein n=1 Tax=Fischerella sp. JS2 TaxID=2597771 RepID=UPI0028EB9100|nr:hypothetical protein [Fischerella sp. JS2]